MSHNLAHGLGIALALSAAVGADT
ncbi:MAG: hypothetical protein QOK44_2324, partial [Betaproteobacteria bacterium]|nr:hypothetical protein [Betaproteobacteria bacterium]